MKSIEDWITIITDMIRNDMNVEITLDRIDADTELGDVGLGLDSLKLIELAVRLEQNFQISVPDEELPRLGGYAFGRFIKEYMGHKEP